MEPALLSAIAAAIGTLAAAYAGFTARKKLSMEAERARAERDSIVVQSAQGAVTLANAQMAELLTNQAAMRREIEAYAIAVEKATSAEINLRLELGKVKKRVLVLEEYITGAGLPIPVE